MTERPLRLHVILSMLLTCLALAAPAFAAEPFARASLQSKGTLYVGQQVAVDVDILVPNYFLQPPQFPLFDLADAVVTLQDGQALNLNETIDGASFSGIRRTYLITGQRPGDFVLPPAEITFGFAAVPGQTAQGKVALPPFRFTIEAAPGPAAGGSAIVAAKVTVAQELDRDAKDLRAGETLLRTVTIRAEGLRAMMIPAPEFGTPQGVRVYLRDPELSEETDQRGQPVAGVRKDVASYLFQNSGRYELPAIELSWFDPATAAKQSVSVPAITVSVSAMHAPSTSLAPPPPPPEATPFNWFRAGVMAAVALASGSAIWILAHGLSWIEEHWEARQSERRESERAYFRHVEDACHDGSSLNIEKAIDAWSRRAGVAPLRSWLRRFGKAEAVEAWEAHQQMLYGGTGMANRSHPAAERLISGLREARSNWLKKDEPQVKARRGTHLPTLNPSWEGKQS